MSLDGFSLNPLVYELNTKLAGGRIDRIYQPNKHTILLSIRQPGQTYTLHISINSQNPVINIISRSLDNPPTPPMFCMVLRKQIEDGRIATIEQFGLDRMLFIHIDILGPGGILLTKTLIIELMGKHSNIILVHDNMIIDALRKVGSNENRLRQILPGKEYIFPPNQDKMNILTMPLTTLIQNLKNCSGLSLEKALIYTILGIGPISAREFIWRAGLPASITIDAMEELDYQSLRDSIHEIVHDYKNNTISPTVITDQNKKILAISSFALEHLKNNNVHSFETISQALDFTTSIAGSYVPPDRDRFKKIIANEITKAKNKLTILEKELVQAHHAEDYKIKADILMTYQYQLKDGYIKEVTLPNIYADNPDQEEIIIALDPLLSPMQNMQKYYQKYNKLKRAQELLAEQIKRCQADIVYLDSIDNSLENSTSQAEFNDIKRELISSGYLMEISKRKMHEKPSEPLQFTFEGTTILVGKNNYQNDRLTFKISKPTDIWLHAKDIPGSHVIIRCDYTKANDNLLVYAAKLAGHFSKAQNSSNIPVDYTKRQYVKKPSGAKPGFVIYTNQKTLYITPDTDELNALCKGIQ